MAHVVTTKPVTRTYIASYYVSPTVGIVQVDDDPAMPQAGQPHVYTFWLEGWIDADGDARSYVACEYAGSLAGAREEVTGSGKTAYASTPTLARYINGATRG